MRIATSLSMMALALSCLPAIAEPACKPEDVLWSAPLENGEVRFYYQEYRGFLAMAGLVRFEHWADGEMKWRIETDLTCSNGVPFCYLWLPIGDDGVDISVQDIWGDDPAPEYMVFAQMAKTAYRRQVYDQERIDFSEHSGDYDIAEPATLPSYYKFVHCNRLGE